MRGARPSPHCRSARLPRHSCMALVSTLMRSGRAASCSASPTRRALRFASMSMRVPRSVRPSSAMKVRWGRWRRTARPASMRSRCLHRLRRCRYFARGRESRGTRSMASWPRGYCPVCGAWPSLAEIRGIERERRLRCGACAADWALPLLRCAYCDELDHEKLGALHAEGEEHLRRVETCESCHGYLKTVTTFDALTARALLLGDIATIELDLVARDRGYARPSRAGWAPILSSDA